MIGPDWLYHPLGVCTGNHAQVLACRSYNFFSGIGADLEELVLKPLAFALALGLWWRRHNCHVHRCWRLQWHVDPATGHPVCRHHHPHDPREIL